MDIQRLPLIISENKQKMPLIYSSSIPSTPTAKVQPFSNNSDLRPSKISYFTKAVAKNSRLSTSKHKNLKLFEELLSKYNGCFTPNSNTNIEKNVENVNKHMKRIRKSLDISFLNPNSSKLLKESQQLKTDLNLNLLNLNSKPRIWRFSSKSIPKSTQKLIDSISQQLSPK